MFAELLGLELEQVSAQGTSSLTLMKDVLSYLWLKGGVDSERPWGAGGEGPLRLPGARLRPALHAAGVVRHRDGAGADDRRRPGRRRGRRAGRRRPDHQGHVAGADVRQPDRPGHHPGGRRAARVDADRGPGLQDLLGQRLRAAPPDRRGDQERRHRVAGRRLPGTRTARSCSRRRRRSPTPAPASRSSAAPRETVELVPRQPRPRLDRPRQGQPPAAPRSSSGRRRACATTWTSTASCSRRSSPRSSGSSTSGSAGSASRPGPSPRGGYFVSLDVLPGTAGPGDRAGQGGRRRADARRARRSPTAATPTTPTSGWRRPSRPWTR